MNLPGLHVLILEDDEDAAEAIADILRAEGCVVKVASTVNEARLALLQSRPAAVIADIMLPEETGLAFVRDLRADPRNDRTVVVFMSGVDEQFGGVGLAVSTLRAAGYLQKPFSAATLLGLLKKGQPHE